MPFRFVLGRAGSGKTRFCLEAVATELRRSPDGPPLIILVPEQATFQMERALVAMDGLQGSVRARVLSFRRLAWSVFAQAGGAARPTIDEVGKAMALRVLLSKRRDELCIFGAARERVGFLKRLASTLSELGAYGIGPAELKGGYEALVALGRGETALAGKLHDLAVVSRDLEDYLAGRFSDPDDYLSLLAAKVGDPRAGLAGAKVWVDSFAGFTPQELSVLAALSAAPCEVTVALCLDSSEVGASRDTLSTFRPTLKTYDALAALAAGAGQPPPEVLRLEGARRFVSPALAHLEREYPNPRPAVFSPATAPAAAPATAPAAAPATAPAAAPAPAVVLVAADSRWAEVAAAAREIARLARQEGYRWREISLVTRSLEPYADLLEVVFAEHRIPFFLDRRKPAAHHPLVELARSAFEAVLQAWAPEPLFRLLKTDLWPLSRDDVDVLENYVLAHGIRGTAWTRPEPWTWRHLYALEEDTPPGPEEEELLARVDALRRVVANVLEPFASAVADGRRRASVRDHAAALWRLIEALDASSTVAAWIDEARAAGNTGLADEHERIWSGFVSLTDQLIANLSDVPLAAEEFLEVLEAGLETLAPGLVPPTLDQVMVGAIDRSRQPEVKAVFVLGVNEGVFPAPMPEDIVFDDKERGELEALGLEMAPSAREKTLAEDYLVYIALTRASERLWVSYSLTDDSGRALGPSVVVSKLRAMFPGLEPRPAHLEPSAAEVPSEAELVAGVTKAIREAGGAGSWPAAYNWLLERPEGREKLRVALGLGATGAGPEALLVGGWEIAGGEGTTARVGLGPELAERLYGETVRVSVSRLEAYAACPFRHFAESGLGLARRPVQELKAPEIGTFYHAVLNLVSRSLGEAGRDLADLPREGLAWVVDAVVRDLEPKLASEVLRSTAANVYASRRLRRTIGRTVDMLQEHARRGSFRPLGTELRFSFEPEGGQVLVRGVIDRLEAARAGPETFVRLLDFKSSQKGWDLRKAFHGLDLQLPVYLLAAINPRTIWEGPPGLAVPAGASPLAAFYFPVVDPFVRSEGPLDDDALEAERYKATQVRGFFLADEETMRLMGSTPGGPPLLPAGLRKDGTPLRAAGVIPRKAAPDDRRSMDLLLKFARRKVLELAARIRRGEVDVSPARYGRGQSACAFCDYRAVCRFDPHGGSSYRRLSWGKPDEIWARMAEEVERG